MMEYFDAGNYFLSGMGFVYDFIPLKRFLLGCFGKMYQKAIAARDHILDGFYFTLRDHADNPEKSYELGLVKNLIKLQDKINKNAGTERITDNDMKGSVMIIKLLMKHKFVFSQKRELLTTCLFCVHLLKNNRV